MKLTKLASGFAFIFAFLRFRVGAIVVTRGYQDEFSNPNQGECFKNKGYCTTRKAMCAGENCCTCKCADEYNTFRSPGVSYYLINGKPEYRFEGPESCVWNHYAHEVVGNPGYYDNNFRNDILYFSKHHRHHGCRFIEEHTSTSSNHFLPLVNLKKNGTLHLKVGLESVHRCNHVRFFIKRPYGHSWAEYEGKRIFEMAWDESKDTHLTLKWRSQGSRNAGLLLKLNFSCKAAINDQDPEPCVILKIKGSYNTKTNSSEVPAELEGASSVRDQQKLEAKLQVTPTPLFNTSQRIERRTEMPNKTNTVDEAADSSKIEDRGETFWILVYLFMAFAIFEVICVALFLIYRQRRKRKRKNDRERDPPPSYDNHAMAVSSVSTNSLSPTPESIEMQENPAFNEPRYSIVKKVVAVRGEERSAVLDGGNISSMEPLQRSRPNSRILQSGSIIVLPKDCVIVHSTGSRKSRTSRHSGHEDDKSSHNNKQTCKSNKSGQNSDDNKSLYSWESFSTLNRTSTDEDYASGSNQAPEEDSLYEEPDKVLSLPKEENKPPLPPITFGLERLFSLQETVISSVQDKVMGNDNGEDEQLQVNDDEEEEVEHIYESPETIISVSYYENAYDLPEDALVEGFEKPNKGLLKHVLHEDKPDEGGPQASLNLGFEFVNNDGVADIDEVILRPKRQSTLFLQEMSEATETRTSVC